MKTFTCKSCAQQVSRKAATCPHCGRAIHMLYCAFGTHAAYSRRGEACFLQACDASSREATKGRKMDMHKDGST
jgi:hypothetical protein